MTPDEPHLAAVARSLRQRWVSGVALATIVTGEGRYRAVTVSSLLLVSNDPPVVAIAVSVAGTFAESLQSGDELGLSVLDRDHEFVADRAAGRGPVPDPSLSGFPLDLLEGVPVVRGALARCACRIQRLEPVGDHVLVMAEVSDGDIQADTDDPLVRYEGRYRRLEAG